MANQGKKEAPRAPPTGLPAHFSMAGTAEHAIVRPPHRPIFLFAT